MQIPNNIRKYLNDRGINDTIIESNKLGWSGTHIVIPVFDPSGKFLFNKYRKDPFSKDDGPKYTYEKGTTAQLYNAHKLPGKNNIIIVEGEFDAMILESHGYLAVSSTGGAGTFKDEWTRFLAGKHIYVCYDNDDAGRIGAIKLLTKLYAKFIALPEAGTGEHGDVTDFFMKTKGNFSLLLEQAESFPGLLARDIDEFKLIKDINAQIKFFKTELQHNLLRERKAKLAARPYRHYDVIRKLLNNGIANLQRELRRRKYANRPVEERRSNNITPDDIIRAKMVPMTNLYSTPNMRTSGGRITGKCPFHEDRGPSLTIFLDRNRWHCFGCGAGHDPIDYYMRIHNCDFIAAVKGLIGKH